MHYKTCCFIGHRNIEISDNLELRLEQIIEDLITNIGIEIFLFGSKSQFNDLCYEAVNKLKKKYPFIKRVYVRAEYEIIGDDYKKYLLGKYDSTYFPKSAVGAGKAVYIKRNFEMIDKSYYCVFYHDENCQKRSGTKIAFEYALKKDCKHIKNVIQ